VAHRPWRGRSGVVLAAGCAVLALGAGGASAQLAAGPTLRSQRQAWRETQAAMLAVYANVQGFPERELPAELEPISLVAAGQILLRESTRSGFGESRRRRAIVRLASAGLEIHESAPGEFGFALGHRDFLEAVEAPLPGIEATVREVIDAIVREDPGVGLAVLRERVAERLPPALFARLDRGGYAVCPVEDLVTVVKTSHIDWQSGCAHPPGDWKSQLTWATTKLRVKRPVGELAKLLDPQNWDASPECNPYFNETCVLAPDLVTCRACPPEPGSAWNAPVYEWFEMYWDPWKLGFKSQLENRLAILSAPTPATNPSSYRLDYCLEASLDGRVGLLRGGIDVDEGFTLASAQPGGWSAVEAHKLIRFQGWKNPFGVPVDGVMNASSGVILQNMGEALVEQLCCGLPDAPSCPRRPGTPGPR